MRVLFVENHAVFAKIVVEQFLSRHEVTVVSSLQAARDALTATFEAMLVDYDLDDGKGASLVRELKKSGTRLFIIGVSARDAGNEALKEAGADAICPKAQFHLIEELLGRVPIPAARSAGTSGGVPEQSAPHSRGRKDPSPVIAAADPTTRWHDRTRDAAATLRTHAAAVDREARFPVESLDALRRRGLLGLTVPTEFGGAAEGPSTFAQVVQTLAEACASTAMVYLMHVCATQVIAAAPDFGRRREVLEAIARGQHLSTLAFSEKGSRSHFWAPVSRLVAGGSANTLSAEKSFVTGAGYADSLLASTREAGDGLAIYYVGRDHPGLKVEGAWQGLGLRGNASAPLRIKKAKLPHGDRVCKQGDGFNTMLTIVLPWFQLGSAAVAMGISRAAISGTRVHLKGARLEHVDEALAALPNLRARLAQMQILADTHETFIQEVARRMETSDASTMLGVLEVKAAAGEAALQVTDLALKACGGAAYRGDLGVERNFRDARACSIMAPTADVLWDFIGKSLLDIPLF